MNTTVSIMQVEGQELSLNCNDFPLENVTTAVGCILAQVCAANEKLLLTRIPPKSRFQATNHPQISIQGYVSRISKYSQCNAQSFILALIYIDRLIQRNPSFLITSLNAHRLFITAIVAAAKFSSDFFFKNSFYAKVGGISTPELNELELEFLFRTHFDLFVDQDTFKQYHAHLIMYSSNSTRIPRQITSSKIPSSKIERIQKTMASEKSLRRSQRCKLQQFAPSRGTEVTCGATGAYNLRSGNSSARNYCQPLRNRYHHHPEKKTSGNRQYHRQSEQENNPFNNTIPFSKRHRTEDSSEIIVATDATTFTKSPVSINMDIWFPMAATTTVAAR